MSATPGTEAIQASTTGPTRYKPQASLTTLQISQYARKMPGNPGPAGNYYIMASVINSTDQYPDGTLLGSTREPTATDDDRVSFQITTDKDVHDITIQTTVLRWKMVDPDSADLVILGFPVRDRQLWSSDSQCEVGRWQPADDTYDQENLPTLGNFARDIRCYEIINCNPEIRSEAYDRWPIYGLGVGKTQIPLEYAYSKQAELDTVLCFPAEDILALQQGFTKIAVDGLGLPNANPQSHQENTLLVVSWFQ
ncbi:MAG: hypothetical protein Q9173_001299 [Seirophora scorigena]